MGNALRRRRIKWVASLLLCLRRDFGCLLVLHIVLQLLNRTWPLRASWQQRNRPLELLTFRWFDYLTSVSARVGSGVATIMRLKMGIMKVASCPSSGVRVVAASVITSVLISLLNACRDTFILAEASVLMLSRLRTCMLSLLVIWVSF